ncbi:MAG: inositol monophosphatase, partial [candidate division NC10 bacterium]|nr:inositol monophosphatase [candidate division NC10 bacterium]
SHSIVSEEGSDHAGSGEVCWILDPLDGTTNFAHGFPFYSVSIAVTVRGTLTVGVVYDPNRDECFVAERGAGAQMNEGPIRVSAIADLTDALLCTGFPYDVREAPTGVVAHFQAFLVRAQAIRRPGSAALDLAYVAAGRLDGFWERKIHVWDLAAGALLIQEAGGRVSDYAGHPLDIHRGEILASNGLLHEAMVRVLCGGEGGER